MDKKEMLFVDFPPVGKITKTVKEKNLKRFFTGGVRINGGKYRTDEEAEIYRRKSLRRALP